MDRPDEEVEWKWQADDQRLDLRFHLGSVFPCPLSLFSKAYMPLGKMMSRAIGCHTLVGSPWMRLNGKLRRFKWGTISVPSVNLISVFLVVAS